MDELEKLLKEGQYKVTDIEDVRNRLKRGCCSQIAYDALTRVIAGNGALIYIITPMLN